MASPFGYEEAFSFNGRGIHSLTIPEEVCESKCVGSADPPQLCICSRMGHIPEVCEFHAAIAAGIGLEADGRPLFQGNTGQLDHLLYRKLLKCQFLMADETRVQVLKEPERKAEADSFMWLFRSGEDGLLVIILYKYTETRVKFYAVEFLGEFRGYLDTYCYQGYDNLPGIRRCCWAHLQRHFVEAVPNGKKLGYSNPTVPAVQYCNKLFEHEWQSQEKGHTFDQRKEYRLQKEKPILDAFWA